MATLIHTTNTLEVWHGEHAPEEGNSATVGQIAAPQVGWIGVVLTVLPRNPDGTQSVLIGWKERLHPRTARPHKATQASRTGAARAVVFENWMEAAQ